MSTNRAVEKVTAFIIRDSVAGLELLLFRHPYAGIQIPAGTVEAGEKPEAAVLREAAEETGLSAFSACRYLGCAVERLPEDQRIILEATRIYSRPDRSSSSWAQLGRGITVTRLRQAGGFSQIHYQEFDRWPDPRYVSMAITGWAPDEALAGTRRRHFFRLDFAGDTPEEWIVQTDNHSFRLFWASVAALPEIVSPQAEWLAYLEHDK